MADLHKIKIGKEIFKVAIADTPSSRYKGLSGLKSLGKNKGLLFIFPEAERAPMVMRNMNFDLDFLFLDDNFEIMETATCKKDDDKPIVPLQPCCMVLEIPCGTIERLNLSSDMKVYPSKSIVTQLKGVKKFKHGGKFEMVGEKVYEMKVDDIKPDPNRLQVLNENGEVVANIDPGARIFSREHTQELLKSFKKGDKLELAKNMINILNIQDNQDPEYVTKDE